MVEGNITHATGEVTLNNNSLLIKPLQSQLENVSGKFRFSDGNLVSDLLSASWFGQPLSVNFTTEEQKDNFLVGVNLRGDWAPARFSMIPADITKLLAGNFDWQGKVAVLLPKNGMPNYQVDVNAELKEVSSHLPPPLDTQGGQSLPVSIRATGDLDGFTLSGSAAGMNHFNSQWLLKDQKVELSKAIWQTASKKFRHYRRRTG